MLETENDIAFLTQVRYFTITFTQPQLVSEGIDADSLSAKIMSDRIDNYLLEELANQ